MRYSLKKNRSLISLIILGLLFPSFCYSALTIKPEIQTVDARHGKKAKAYIWVKNESDKKISIEVQHEDWTESKESKKQIIKNIKVKPKWFVIKPNRTKKVKIKVLIPESFHKNYLSQVFFKYIYDIKNDSFIGLRIGSTIRWKIVQ